MSESKDQEAAMKQQAEMGAKCLFQAFKGLILACFSAGMSVEELKEDIEVFYLEFEMLSVNKNTSPEKKSQLARQALETLKNRLLKKEGEMQ